MERGNTMENNNNIVIKNVKFASTSGEFSLEELILPCTTEAFAIFEKVIGGAFEGISDEINGNKDLPDVEFVTDELGVKHIVEKKATEPTPTIIQTSELRKIFDSFNVESRSFNTKDQSFRPDDKTTKERADIEVHFYSSEDVSWSWLKISIMTIDSDNNRRRCRVKVVSDPENFTKMPESEFVIAKKYFDETMNNSLLPEDVKRNIEDIFRKYPNNISFS